MDDCRVVAVLTADRPGPQTLGKHTPHIGNARLRSSLWMPLVAAVTHNKWLRAFYQRLLAAGKLPKVALVASMRKLLHAVYSVATNRRLFVSRLPEVAS